MKLLNAPEIMEKKEINYFELDDIETFLRLNEYPKTIRECGANPILNGFVKTFSIENRQILYKRQPVVVMAKQ